MTSDAARCSWHPACSWRLVIDTATRRTVVAVGRGHGSVAADVVATRADRHGARPPGPAGAGVLAEAGIGMADVEAIGVGSGPGQLHGAAGRPGHGQDARRAATPGARGAAHRRGAAPAAGSAAGPGALRTLVVLPAGAHDHYLGLPGADPVLVPPGTDLDGLVGDRPVVAVDVDGDAAGSAPLDDGRAGRRLARTRRARPGRPATALPARAPGAARRPARAAVTWPTPPRSCPATWPCRGASRRRPPPRPTRSTRPGRGGDMVARLPLTLRIEPDDRRRHRAGPRHRAGQLPGALAVVRVPPGARDQPHGALPGGSRRRRDWWRTAASG